MKTIDILTDLVQKIKNNTLRLITGDVLQGVLNNMINRSDVNFGTNQVVVERTVNDDDYRVLRIKGLNDDYSDGIVDRDGSEIYENDGAIFKYDTENEDFTFYHKTYFANEVEINEVYTSGDRKGQPKYNNGARIKLGAYDDGINIKVYNSASDLLFKIDGEDEIPVQMTKAKIAGTEIFYDTDEDNIYIRSEFNNNYSQFIIGDGMIILDADGLTLNLSGGSQNNKEIETNTNKLRFTALNELYIDAKKIFNITTISNDKKVNIDNIYDFTCTNESTIKDLYINKGKIEFLTDDDYDDANIAFTGSGTIKFNIDHYFKLIGSNNSNILSFDSNDLKINIGSQSIYSEEINLFTKDVYLTIFSGTNITGKYVAINVENNVIEFNDANITALNNLIDKKEYIMTASFDESRQDVFEGYGHAVGFHFEDSYYNPNKIYRYYSGTNASDLGEDCMEYIDQVKDTVVYHNCNSTDAFDKYVFMVNRLANQSGGYDYHIIMIVEYND